MWEPRLAVELPLARLDVIDVEPHALLRPTPACHARLVAVFEQDLIPDLRPLVRVQKLPAGWVLEMLRVRPPKADALSSTLSNYAA